MTATASADVTWPASLDRDLVQAIAYGGTPGHQLHRWRRDAVVRHCAIGVDPAIVTEAADTMARLTGLRQTPEGVCNVTWEVAAGHPVTYLSIGQDGSIAAARITLPAAGADADAAHELGHAMGLEHSPRSSDLMYATPRGRDFSEEELAILAVMYSR